MELELKPTDLKLEQFDEDTLRRMYMDIWFEKAVSGGPETWFEVVMRFLEYKGYEIIKATPESGE